MNAAQSARFPLSTATAPDPHFRRLRDVGPFVCQDLCFDPQSQHHAPCGLSHGPVSISVPTRTSRSASLARAAAALSPTTTRVSIAATLLAALAVIAGCGRAPVREPERRPSDVRAQIVRLLPAKTVDREGWAADIYAAFAALRIEPSTPNLCATIAVAEQESGVVADPTVPNLGRIAGGEIDRRAATHHLPPMLVHAALKIDSPTGKSYGERIAAARTEGELSRIYEDLIASVPLGQALFAEANPVRTGGSMQVGIEFAERQAREKPYPYPVDGSIRHELFTRRGGVYFGIAHLLDYRAPYDRPLYRFADFNAGRYASRNAAFQSAVAVVSGIPLALDGDLVGHGETASDGKPGATELAVRALAPRIGAGDAQIRRALEQGESDGFEKTAVYRRVFELADRLERHTLPRAVVPQITLNGPKITRKLTTAWYAGRVDDRYRACMAK